MSGRPIPYKQLLALSEYADSYSIPVPGVPGEAIQVQPVGRTRWTVARRTLFGRECLTGDGWRPDHDVADGEMSTWPLPQALMAAEVAAEMQAAAHAAWKIRHEAERARELAAVAEELLEPVREALAEGSVA